MVPTIYMAKLRPPRTMLSSGEEANIANQFLYNTINEEGIKRMVGNCGTEKCRMLQSEKTCFKDGVVAGWRREILREEVVTVVLQNQ